MAQETKPETSSVDPAATRRRLVSFVGTGGYRSDLLARIARLCVELEEPAQAGRYWLLSEASGPDVEAAIEAFAESCQRTPRLMASELPRFNRDWDVGAYPDLVKARIAKYRLEAELSRRAPKGSRRKRPGTALVAVAGVVLLAVFAAVLVLLRR